MKRVYPKQIKEIIDSVLKDSTEGDNFLRQQACYL